MCEKRHTVVCKFEYEMPKLPIKRRMCAAKNLTLSERQRVCQILCKQSCVLQQFPATRT